MSLTKDEIAETFYTAGLTTLGAVGVGYVSRKLMRDGLGILTTPMPIAKLAVTTAVSSLLVQYLRIPIFETEPQRIRERDGKTQQGLGGPRKSEAGLDRTRDLPKKQN